VLECTLYVFVNFNLEGVLVVNKNELIASVASATGLTKTDSAKAVDAFVASVTSALKKGDEVRLVGFGTFSVTKRAATTGRNPRTGAEIKIAARKQAKFKAGKALQESVN
jgi:DNA-binding protein HU-beta